MIVFLYQIGIHAWALASNLELCDISSPNLQTRTYQVQAMPNYHAGFQQGMTIATDLIISGSIIFSDAAWKCKSIPGENNPQVTGIGVFIKSKLDGKECKVLIQASAPHASSVFQAEAKALAFAARVAQHLQIQKTIVSYR